MKPGELLDSVARGAAAAPTPRTGSGAVRAASCGRRRPIATCTCRSAWCRARSARRRSRLTDAELARGDREPAGLGSARLDARPGGARAACCSPARSDGAAMSRAPRPAVQRRRRGRAGGVLSRPAALSGSAAARAARGRGRALQHARGVRGGGAPQPLSRRAVRRAGLEPDGAQGAVRRAARCDPIVGPRRARQSRAGAHALRLRARALGGRAGR